MAKPGDYAKEAERYSSGRFMNREDSEVFKEARNLTNEMKDSIAAMNPLMASVSGMAKDYAGFLSSAKEMKQGGNKLTMDDIENFKHLNKQGMKFVGAINELAPGLVSIADGAYQTSNAIDDLIPGVGKFAFGLGIALKIATSVASAIADTRKDLGVSATEAAKVTAQNKALGLAATAVGLTQEDVEAAQKSIREDLGASVGESVKLSLSFAKTAAATGQTSDELTTTLSLMESISGSSREVLLNQIKSNAAMIQAAGVAPSLVMKDLAQNTEFFAQFAKDGNQNLIMAGTAARKLGLDMSAVVSITESLLDFESSIEKSLEASMLLGRSINTDRARMLAIQGDQAGMMKEILRQVGGEAEFNRLSVLQRRALAESVGVNVEQLSRLVRNNQASASGQITRADGATNMEKLQSVSNEFLESADGKLGKLVRLMG